MRINLEMLRLAIINILISMCGGRDEVILTKSVSRCSWSARWDRDAKLISTKLIKTKARTKGLTWRGNKVKMKVTEKRRER